jgi:uncharacterized protein (TIGR03437 family)
MSSSFLELFKPIRTLFFFATISCAFGQTAVIKQVANAASGSSKVIVPQMLVSIYGSNLANQIVAAPITSFPTTLGGTTVTFNGVPAPLLYVSAGQINAQVPGGIQGSASANVIVETAVGPSAAFPVTVTPMGITSASPSIASFGSAPGIFTQDSSGCGQAAALNIHADGSSTPNTPQSSFDPQQDAGFAIYLTGLGYFAGRTDGLPYTFNASDNRNTQFGVTVGAVPGVDHASTNLATSYAGPAPGFVGVDQINAMYYNFGPMVTVPLPEGCRMPLFVIGSGTTALSSQLVNVSIHSGGGACTDQPTASVGVATWQQNVISDTTGMSSSTSVAVQFSQGPGILGPEPPPVVSVAPSENYGSAAPPPAVCAASFPGTMDVGTLTVTTPGSHPVSLQSQNQNGVISYQLPPSPGTIQGGTYSIADSVRLSSVGPFTANATLPAPIMVTTNLNPGTPISLPFTVNWTGGGAESVVTVQLNVLVPGQLTTPVLSATSPATDGMRTLTLPAPPASVFSMPSGAAVEIIVTQQPAQVPANPFIAAGLTLGGEQGWNYTFDFKGLVAQ